MAVRARKWCAIAAATAFTGVGVGAVVPPTAPAVAARAALAAPAPGRVPGSALGVPLGARAGGPASLVNPMDGTGVGTANPGNVSEYPGASVPLGMVQFSPDTSPDRQVTTGSGYDYADSKISGFSLTHLSGDGCAIYGDVPILPVVGALPTDPDAAVQPFTHADERASAGNYAVSLGEGPPARRIGVRLTATTRSAMAAFTFPAVPAGQNDGPTAGDELLFKANGSTNSRAQVLGSNALVGSVTSGDFCGIPGSYTLYFSARFSQRFSASGTWHNGASGGQASCSGSATGDCGAWVRFGHPGATARRIMVKVGVSFVSVAGATANLDAEDPGWSFQRISGDATSEWNGLLGRVAVAGGFSDDDGDYVGFDNKIHTLHSGQVQYSNFSECDIYHSEVPLLALLLPGPTSQMMQSLLRDAAQNKGGFLPKWVIAGSDAGEWDGDSVDAVIADAYAYGARQFNVKEALSLMVRGATVPGTGFIVERQNLLQYEAQGWVPQLTYDETSYPYTVGGSETLEYSLDDFAISQLARALGNSAVAATFSKRGQNWQNLFDASTGYLAARTADGSFPPGPAFQPASASAQAQGIAQEGFEEGNAIQYTWAVPQNLAALIGLMGGDGAAVGKLNAFFTHLNATRFAPYDWAGNEPSMSAPYVYDYAGEPWGTQSVVRRIMHQLYAAAPVDEPGEDDLGALSSWYVWSALGLYPETPGVADLAMTSPIFPRARIVEGNGHTLTIVGARAPDTFIQSAALAIGSRPSRHWDKPWVPGTVLTDGGTLSVVLGEHPDTRWGAAAAEAPPSFSEGAAPAVPFTMPEGALDVSAGSATPFVLGAQSTSTAAAAPVTWHVVSPVGAAGPTGITVSPDAGTLSGPGVRPSIALTLTAPHPGTFAVTFDLTQGATPLPSVTLDVHAS